VHEVRRERQEHAVGDERGRLHGSIIRSGLPRRWGWLTLHINVRLRSCGPVRATHVDSRPTTSALGMISDIRCRCTKPSRMRAS
jgi:hypothetical protein